MLFLGKHRCLLVTLSVVPKIQDAEDQFATREFPNLATGQNFGRGYLLENRQTLPRLTPRVGVGLTQLLRRPLRACGKSDRGTQ